MTQWCEQDTKADRNPALCDQIMAWKMNFFENNRIIIYQIMKASLYLKVNDLFKELEDYVGSVLRSCDKHP